MAWFSTHSSSGKGDIEGIPNLSVNYHYARFLSHLAKNWTANVLRRYRGLSKGGVDISTSSLTSRVDRMPTPLEMQR